MRTIEDHNNFPIQAIIVGADGNTYDLIAKSQQLIGREIAFYISAGFFPEIVSLTILDWRIVFRRYHKPYCANVDCVHDSCGQILYDTLENGSIIPAGKPE